MKSAIFQKWVNYHFLAQRKRKIYEGNDVSYTEVGTLKWGDGKKNLLTKGKYICLWKKGW
jgi:hypothetical protein